jgi:RNA polymerase sigma-70 factor, ECF subfamily
LNPTLEQVHEQLIVLRCQAGDEQALVELMAKYHRRLTFYLRRLLPDRGDEEAALQEVWLSVHRQLPKLRERAAFRTWLYRLARDRALVELRRKRIPFAPLQEQEAAADEEPEFGPEDAQYVHRGLDRLSREHREVLTLRFLEDMSYEDIARVIGCQVGTIRSRLHYAKSALRKILEEDLCHE